MRLSRLQITALSAALRPLTLPALVICVNTQCHPLITICVTIELHCVPQPKSEELKLVYLNALDAQWILATANLHSRA